MVSVDGFLSVFISGVSSLMTTSDIGRGGGRAGVGAEPELVGVAGVSGANREGVDGVAESSALASAEPRSGSCKCNITQ